MELWQLDLVGGFLLADGTRAKALTGVDDHSRFCVCAALMPRERTQPVCDAFAAALRTHGVPEQVLTDNGKVFTGRFGHPPDRGVVRPDLSRERDRAPAHRAPLPHHHRQDRAIPPLTADRVPDRAGVLHLGPARRPSSTRGSPSYNHDRPHQSLDMATPAERFGTAPRRRPAQQPDRTGPEWVARKVSTVGVVCVSWQQISVGRHRPANAATSTSDPTVLQLWVGNELCAPSTATAPAPSATNTPRRALTKTPRAH